MRNLFDILKDASKGANNETKKYWESSSNSFTKAIDPDGNIYDEQKMFEEIQKSDRDRLFKFG